MEKIGLHERVWEYDGAFRCMRCKEQWGALPGHPLMPEKCLIPSERCISDNSD